eukprot:TRINITY_DN5419_c0_g1_i1.p1 TRINITY_DN5419_c0_g1~~TRINITY_DN5419_c0_g1_i1.p1  ORF type:complete len:338 (-),score=164.75 TRINITY_DN5419_c0_g1_i1:56-961(-)
MDILHQLFAPILKLTTKGQYEEDENDLIPRSHLEEEDGEYDEDFVVKEDVKLGEGADDSIEEDDEEFNEKKDHLENKSTVEKAPNKKNPRKKKKRVLEEVDNKEFEEDMKEIEEMKEKKNLVRVPLDWSSSENQSIKSVYAEYKDREDDELLERIKVMGDFDEIRPPTLYDIANHLLHLKLLSEERYLSVIAPLDVPSKVRRETSKRKNNKRKKNKEKSSSEGEIYEEDIQKENVPPNKKSNNKKRKLTKKSSSNKKSKVVEEMEDEIVLHGEDNEDVESFLIEEKISSGAQKGVIEDDDI